MGQCWSGIVSICRLHRNYQERDGFLIEMNSMNFDDHDHDTKRSIFEWSDESSKSFSSSQCPPAYFTLDYETDRRSTETISEKECSHRPVYREILNPVHLNVFFNTSRSTNYNDRKVPKAGSSNDSYSPLKNSKHGSIASIDLEWENEECLELGSCTHRQPLEKSVNYVLLEENGNGPAVRWSCSGAPGPSNSSPRRSLTLAKESRASSETSLSWDNDNQSMYVGEELHSFLDSESENLISEIEKLTTAALRETAQWATFVDQPAISFSEPGRADLCSPSAGQPAASSSDLMMSSIDTDSSV